MFSSQTSSKHFFHKPEKLGHDLRVDLVSVDTPKGLKCLPVPIVVQHVIQLPQSCKTDSWWNLLLLLLFCLSVIQIKYVIICTGCIWFSLTLLLVSNPLI